MLDTHSVATTGLPAACSTTFLRLAATLLSALLLLVPASLGALEDDITLSVSNRNGDYLYQQGLMFAEGLRGKPELRLQDREYQVERDTDLLLHFNTEQDLQDGGYYQQTQAGTISDTQKKLGSASGLFNGNNGIALDSRNGSLFYPGTFMQSFSIEFWLYPASTDDGQYLFRWDGEAWLSENRLTQHFSAAIRNRAITWTIHNLFISPESGQVGGGLASLSFKLSTKREIVPRTWNHHLLRYDAKRGFMEYLVNGIPEDSRYTTVSGRETAQLYQAYAGERSKPRITIGQSTRGFIDEFRISRSVVQAPVLEPKTEPGWVIFNPVEFRLIGAGSKIVRINATRTAPGATGLGFFYMMLDSTFPPSVLRRDDKRWIRFEPGAPISDNNTGLWLYIKVEFYPDGKGLDSPGLQDIKISYIPDPPPPPPSGLKAVPGNGSLTVSWNPVPGTDIQGYLVYYGTKPGQYSGVAAVQGASPLNVRNTTSIILSGLENNRVYYIAVACYDRSTSPEIGMDIRRGISKEVSARPAH